MYGKMKVIPKGALFTVTIGEYSDYETLTVCKALVEINCKSLEFEYISEYPEQAGDYQMDKSKVLNWMTNIKGYAEEVEFFELHIGDYSTADFCLRERED